jgi:hypothetical protein
MGEEPETETEALRRMAVEASIARRTELGLPRYVEDPLALDSMATILIEHDRAATRKHAAA